MKKSNLFLAGLLAVFIGSNAGVTNAAPSLTDVDLSGSVGASNKYIFRGVDMSGNPSVQGSATVGYSYFSLTGDLYTLTTTQEVKFDTTVKVAVPLMSIFSVNAGLVNYSYFGETPSVGSNNELFLGADVAVGDYFGAGLTAYKDTNRNDIWIDLSANQSVYSFFDLYGTISYAMYEAPAKTDAFEVATVGVSKTFDFSKNNITAYGEAVIPLRGVNSINLPTSTEYVFGASLNF